MWKWSEELTQRNWQVRAVQPGSRVLCTSLRALCAFGSQRRSSPFPGGSRPRRESGQSGPERAPGLLTQAVTYLLRLDCGNSPGGVHRELGVTEAWEGGACGSQAVRAGKRHERHHHEGCCTKIKCIVFKYSPSRFVYLSLNSSPLNLSLLH